MIGRSLLRGAAAGAAGTTALNAVTYLDMAIRGRPASDVPQQAIEKLGSSAGIDIPGHGEERDNRLAGLGPLSGAATGVAVGAAAGLLGPVLGRLPTGVAGLLIGAAAMAAANVPLARLRLTDPTQWSPADWLSDIVPHVAYGAVTAATLDALRH